jgi:hypothetical protein
LTCRILSTFETALTRAIPTRPCHIAMRTRFTSASQPAHDVKVINLL